MLMLQSHGDDTSEYYPPFMDKSTNEEMNMWEPNRNRLEPSREEMNMWEPNSQVSILVAGKSGTGKSTLINTLLRRDVEEVEDMVDSDVSHGPIHNFEGPVTVVFWDSSTEDNQEKVEERINEVDLIIFTIRMDDTRLRPEDANGIRKLSSKFLSSTRWKNVLFVLTFANKVDYLNEYQRVTRSKEHFMKRFQQWRTHIYNILQEEGVPEVDIPVIPAGHHAEPKLFNSDEDWMNILWDSIVHRAKGKARPALLRIRQHQ